MRLYFDDRQLAHRPTQYFTGGRMIRPLENPDRPPTLAKALCEAGLERAPLTDTGLGAIEAVHDAGYLAFLRTAFDRFAALPGGPPEVLPNVHPYRAADDAFANRPPPKVTGIIGLAGWYMGDMSSAMTAGTYDAAYWSAQTAINATLHVLSGLGSAYALCRPPGHHAYRDRASGFCFLNNAAIAAQTLREAGARVAILDFDTHHGDGTQAIFYGDADVFVGSVHTDPAEYYPWFAGYADETGAGEGRGTTLNVPLAPGADDHAFVAAVERLVSAIRAFGATALVVSAGWDAHRDDPLSKLAVTSAAYERIGWLIGRMERPTVIVQEGGYSLQAISEAGPRFVRGVFEAERRIGMRDPGPGPRLA